MTIFPHLKSFNGAVVRESTPKPENPTILAQPFVLPDQQQSGSK
jgi:hypothetical protein